LPGSAANIELTDAPLVRQWPWQRLAHAARHALFADVEARQFRDLRALVELVDLLLEGATRHLAVHVIALLRT
jgi:hypothetical protein